MKPAEAPALDLFIVHAEADRAFVDGYLLHAIGISGERILVLSGLELGRQVVSEIERGIETSHITVIVATPTLFAERSSDYAEQLAAAAIRRGDRRVIPLLLEDCKLPLRLDGLTKLDFRNRDGWTAGVQELLTALALPQPAEVDVPCPYPGNRAFGSEDALRFFGRERELSAVIDRLGAGERELYIVGPSASGKSSFLAAGLATRLSGGIGTLGQPAVRSLVVCEQPSAALAELLRDEPEGAWVLLIDQLEVLFTRCDRAEQERFALAVGALRSRIQVILVFALRGDHYGSLMESELRRNVDAQVSTFELLPLRGLALRQAIEAPAHAIGGALEGGLVDRLIDEAAASPGSLPLLQDTLTELWKRRRGRLLTIDAYESMGDGGRTRMEVAIAVRADVTMKAMSGAERAVATRALLRLVSFSDGGLDSPRPQRSSALIDPGDDPSIFVTVLERLTAARIVIARNDGSDRTLELCHSALVPLALQQGGPALRYAEQQRRIWDPRAAEWEASECRDGLLDASELEYVDRWLSDPTTAVVGCPARVKALVAASRTALEVARGQLDPAAFPQQLRYRNFVPGRKLVIDGTDISLPEDNQWFWGVFWLPIAIIVAIWFHIRHTNWNSWGLIAGLLIMAMYYVARWSIWLSWRSSVSVEFDFAQRTIENSNDIFYKSTASTDDLRIVVRRTAEGWAAHLLYRDKIEIVKTGTFATRENAVDDLYDFGLRLNHALGISNMKISDYDLAGKDL